MVEQIGVIEVPKISSPKSVDVVESILQKRISERMCEQCEVIDVTKISSQDQSWLRTTESMVKIAGVKAQYKRRLRVASFH